MDCSQPDSSVRGILQARILEWIVISFSRGSSRPRDQTMYIQYSYNIYTCTQLIVVSNYTQSSMYFLQLFGFSVLHNQLIHLTFSAVGGSPHPWGFFCREAFGVSTGGGGQGRPSRPAGQRCWCAGCSSRFQKG